MKGKPPTRPKSNIEVGQSSIQGRIRKEKVSSKPPLPNASTTDSSFNQSAAQRRILRSRYHALKASIAEDREGLLKVDSDKFQSIISKAENLHEQVQRPREQVADAEALSDLSQTLLSTVKRSQTSDGLTPTDFVSAVLSNFRDISTDSDYGGTVCISWEKIGLASSSVFQSSTGLCTMLGPLNIEHKQRKSHIQRKRTKPTESTKPEAVKDSSEAEKSETDKNMAVMFNILRKHKKVGLQNLVLNRISFSQTVENIFSLSFLVKDGRVAIEVGEDKNLIVVPRNAPSAGELASGDASYNQFVFRFDFSDWKVMKDEVENGKELMPHRTIIDGSSCSNAMNENFSDFPENLQQTKPETPIRKISRHRGRVLQQAAFERDEIDEPGGSIEDDDCLPSDKKGKRRLL